jgi:arginyl-tRNA synthetase
MHANRIIYVVDFRQSDHFDQVFAVGRKAGFLPDDVVTEHVAFGTVLGTDGKPFKTREGTAVTLNALLDAAEQQAAPPIALAAIKYADLSNGLNKDYVFDINRMVQTTGNTGPYLQYAHARITSIFGRTDARPGPIVVTEAAERALLKELLAFEPVVRDAGTTCEFHRLAAHLYAVASLFSAFYECCPVLKAPPGVRASRLGLCDLTARTLRTGLDLLGIAAPGRM